MVLEDGVLNGFFYACILGCGGKVGIVFAQLPAKQQALFVFAQTPECGFVLQFLAAGLHGKVVLPCGNDAFGRIAVLHNQVAGIAGKAVIRHFALPAFSEGYHFVGFNKMMIFVIS